MFAMYTATMDVKCNNHHAIKIKYSILIYVFVNVQSPKNKIHKIFSLEH